MNIDPADLLPALDPEGRGGRHEIDAVADAIRFLTPDIDAADLPGLVLKTVQAGVERGLWSSARTMVLRGRTSLPKTINLPRTAVSGERLQPITVPLRHELASWAATLPLSRAQREVLQAVNQWLRETDGGNVPIVEAAERAYQLLGDEKAFDSTPPRGGVTLWSPGRLTLELLRCHRTPTPLTWEPTTTVIGLQGPVLCVENHATFRSLLRVLRAQPQPRWRAVAWVQGRNTAPLSSLKDLPFTVSHLDYLGDLDPAGLEIAATACEVARQTGITAGPADSLWQLLIRQPSRRGPQVSEVDARRLVAWLPASVQETVFALITAGQAVPQEALRFDVLEQHYELMPTPGGLPES
ncbi:hypothetical protein [Cryptosporangium sp. NPDC048952]|uniref:hypothetical protein n=1 Tax=Cryptosporangium sp. NPDC048952 TaxID=3363961 RepID=UPI003721380D